MTKPRIELAPDFLAELATLPREDSDRIWQLLEAAQKAFALSLDRQERKRAVNAHRNARRASRHLGEMMGEHLIAYWAKQGIDLHERNRKLTFTLKRMALSAAVHDLTKCGPLAVSRALRCDHSTVIHHLKKHPTHAGLYADYTRVYFEALSEGRRWLAKQLHTPVEGVEGNTAAA